MLGIAAVVVVCGSGHAIAADGNSGRRMGMGAETGRGGMVTVGTRGGFGLAVEGCLGAVVVISAEVVSVVFYVFVFYWIVQKDQAFFRRCLQTCKSDCHRDKRLMLRMTG
jgi:hypothetical protein